jgi:hypothetical protein
MKTREKHLVIGTTVTFLVIIFQDRISNTLKISIQEVIVLEVGIEISTLISHPKWMS